MRISLQVIENYKQAVPSIVLSAGGQKYIFNVPQSFQRFSKEHRFKFNKGSILFFTKTCSATVTGLLGLMLTLVDQGQSYDTKMYMVPRLFDYFNEIRYQKGYKILPYAFMDWTGRYQQGMGQQSVQKLVKLPNYPYLFHHIKQYISKLPSKQINNPSIYYKNTHFEDQNIKIIPLHIKSTQQITQFICISPNIPGKVNVQKLKQYKITGKSIGQFMKDGQFTLQTGQKLFSKDFRDQQIPGSVFLILHFDNLQTLQQTQNQALFKQYLHKVENAIIIIENPEIVQSQKFKQFISLFNQKSHHLLYCSGYRNTDQYFPELTKHYRLTNKLSKFFPKHIPSLGDNKRNQYLESIKNQKIIQQIFPERNIDVYKRYFELVITPIKSKSYTFIKQETIQDEPFDDIKFDQPASTQKIWDFNKSDPLIVFLGTGSMKPAAYRNVSAIFVGFNKSSVLLDCGQGTYLQMLNHFHNQIDQVMLSLRVIFITHVHSDHHLGILNLITQRKKVCQKLNLPNDDLFLVIPYNLAPAVWAYQQYIEKLNCSIVFIQTLKGQSYSVQGNMSKDDRKCYKLDPKDISSQNYSTPKQKYILQNYFSNQKQMLQKFTTYLNQQKIVEFNPVHVIHCPQSYGIVIKHQSGIKISYSGDTRPCTQFIKASTNSTIMIHEATFGDDLADNAKQNFHSTVGQAVYSGMKSNSWRLALTHFSQRYKNSASIMNLQQYKSDQKTHHYAKQNSIVCFDHLQMKLSQSEYMPQVSRLIADILPNDK